MPVHPELVRVGFLDFVARQRTAGFEHLFPELKFDRRGYRSDAHPEETQPADRAGGRRRATYQLPFAPALLSRRPARGGRAP